MIAERKIDMEILKLLNVKKYYGTKTNITKAVNDLSLQVTKGEFVAIMGASGSGKTTLLNCISTIDEVTSGHIYIGDKDITELKEKELAKFRRENLGFIFQDFNLLDTLTISENISLALVINEEDVNEVDNKVNDIADKLGILNILDKYPYEVSGGQKQRCACARALINEPKLILADEPTGALDSKSSRMLLETMDEMNNKLKATILMVTHDSFSASFCHRVLFLKDGKIFNEIVRGEKSRKEFFNEILDVLTLLGGDDFITKPYNKTILLEKIKRALRQFDPIQYKELKVKDMVLDLHLSIVKHNDKEVELTRNEFHILYYFFMNPDKLITKEELLDYLWNEKYYLDDNILNVNLNRLRKKLKEIDQPDFIKTIRGQGYQI